MFLEVNLHPIALEELFVEGLACNASTIFFMSALVQGHFTHGLQDTKHAKLQMCCLPSFWQAGLEMPVILDHCKPARGMICTCDRLIAPQSAWGMLHGSASTGGEAETMLATCV